MGRQFSVISEVESASSVLCCEISFSSCSVVLLYFERWLPPRTIPTGTPATAVAGAPSSYPTPSILGEPGPGAGSSALGAVSSPEQVALGQVALGQVAPAVSPGRVVSPPATADALMGALATLISRAVTKGMVAAGGALGQPSVLPGIGTSGVTPAPSSVAPTPSSSSLPAARGELYSSSGSFRRVGSV